MKLTKAERTYWREMHTHPDTECAGRPCVVHHPSDHHMRSRPLHYRPDRGITERICPHGVGHPDPDDPEMDRTHGCCMERCCLPTHAGGAD